MFSDPTTPNLPDFFGYALAQGVPSPDLPSGSLSTVTIDLSGNLAGTPTGIIQSGELLLATGIHAATYITAWNGTSGTVSPAPIAAVAVATAQAYSPYAAWALNYAMAIALPGPGNGPGLTGMAGMYVMAVYNLGVHQLLKIGQDQTNQTFFTQMRQTYRLTSLVPGPVMASGDQATSETLVVPEFFKNITLSELDLLKTPYGREYMAYAQMYGPTIVGAT